MKDTLFICNYKCLLQVILIVTQSPLTRTSAHLESTQNINFCEHVCTVKVITGLTELRPRAAERGRLFHCLIFCPSGSLQEYPDTPSSCPEGSKREKKKSFLSAVTSLAAIKETSRLNHGLGSNCNKKSES